MRQDEAAVDKLFVLYLHVVAHNGDPFDSALKSKRNERHIVQG